mmetsp:Transcript_94896/g.267946  ORF Transcript_94896/g.267946 Transcript_94896/m.267946 type:complete len:366 (+) Transcript_94896:507-1604(+)
MGRTEVHQKDLPFPILHDDGVLPRGARRAQLDVWMLARMLLVSPPEQDPWPPAQVQPLVPRAPLGEETVDVHGPLDVVVVRLHAPHRQIAGCFLPIELWDQGHLGCFAIFLRLALRLARLLHSPPDLLIQFSLPRRDRCFVDHLGRGDGAKAIGSTQAHNGWCNLFRIAPGRAELLRSGRHGVLPPDHGAARLLDRSGSINPSGATTRGGVATAVASAAGSRWYAIASTAGARCLIGASAKGALGLVLASTAGARSLDSASARGALGLALASAAGAQWPVDASATGARGLAFASAAGATCPADTLVNGLRPLSLRLLGLRRLLRLLRGPIGLDLGRVFRSVPLLAFLLNLFRHVKRLGLSRVLCL